MNTNETTRHKRIPRRFQPILFGLILSGLMTLVVSAVTTARNLGINDHFVGRWLAAFGSSWPITFPTATIVAPFVRRLVERLIEPSS
jgi:Ca2+/Na+ antiporter